AIDQSLDEIERQVRIKQARQRGPDEKVEREKNAKRALRAALDGADQRANGRGGRPGAFQMAERLRPGGPGCHWSAAYNTTAIVIPGAEPTGPAFGRPDDRLREADPGPISNFDRRPGRRAQRGRPGTHNQRPSDHSAALVMGPGSRSRRCSPLA